MVGKDDSSGPETGNQDADPRAPRKQGVFFWLAMVCLPVTITVGVIDRDLLNVGIFSALGLYLILQQTGLRERSAAWKWGCDACAIVFSVLVLLLFLRNFGLV